MVLLHPLMDNIVMKEITLQEAKNYHKFNNIDVNEVIKIIEDLGSKYHDS